jgi:hypothetical protein
MARLYGSRSTIVLLLLCFATSFSQTITWTEITSAYIVPQGVKVFKGERISPALRAFYIDVDATNSNLAVRPYLSAAAAGKELLVPFTQRVGAYAGVNGGFFSSTTSVSAVVYPDSVLAKNPASLVRSPYTFYPTRSIFGINARRKFSVDWIYHFGNNVSDIVRYSSPSANTPTVPAPAPTVAAGLRYFDLIYAIGGGPTLVKNKQVNITYNEEVMFGSGVGSEAPDPRTAVGYTAANHVVLFVADGRQTASVGLSLPELAQVMIDLGCVEAMNLDGGGSTQMAVAGSYVDIPSESREVPTMLAVVPADSARFPLQYYYESIIDSGDPQCSFIGGTKWYDHNAAGYWGSTKAKVTQKGTGDATASFAVTVPKKAVYDLYAWWPNTLLNAQDVPFIVTHATGRETLKINQNLNPSRWNRIGSYLFGGENTNTVVVTNGATAGTLICVDAIRLISYDSNTTYSQRERTPRSYDLLKIFPNPFNAETTIQFHLNQTGQVRLRMYDLLGREVALLVGERRDPGDYQVRWNAGRLPSGVYICRMDAGTGTTHLKALLLK